MRYVLAAIRRRHPVAGQAAERSPKRLRLRAEHETWMMMSGLVALCSLFIVGVLVLPVFGARVGAVAAVTVVAVIVFVCYFICVPRTIARFAPTIHQGGSRRDV